MVTQSLVIAYDADLGRPGCVLIQAAMGATHGIAECFEPSTWLLAPTPAMRLYPIKDEEQLARLVQITEARNNKGVAA